jgi:Ca-activated chloride channel family protein
MKKTTGMCMIAVVCLALAVLGCAPAPRAATGGEAAQPPAKQVIGVQPLEEAAEELPEPLLEAEAPADMDFAGAAAPAATMPQVEGEQGGGPPPPDQPPPDMTFFEEYGVNPFVATAEDNLSTFAVDVDTGSYTVTRSYINDGYLPPPEAIRLEEFVNYFEQEYPLPQQDAFNIFLEAAPTPFNVEGNVVMRVGVQGYDIAPDQRPDATLIFVIDVSGSMDMDNRLGAVKKALNTLTDHLRPTDRIGIVVYGSNGRVVLEPTPVSQQSQIVLAIDALQPEGSTNAEEGLMLAYQMATANFVPGQINRLILCSDGVANVGATGPDSILETVKQQARDGITLTTVGFGMSNYNDVLMEQLADDGDGQYFYVDTQSEAERIFVDKLTGTLLTIARDTKIQVEFNPETVSYYRLMGYENRDVADEDFRNDAVDAGEVGAGHSVTALYELVLNAQAAGSVATVRLRWEDPDSGEVTEIERSLDTVGILPTFDDASPRFRLDVAVAAFADMLGEGAWSQTADLDTLYELAVGLTDDLPYDTDVREFAGLVQRAIGLRGQ